MAPKVKKDAPQATSTQNDQKNLVTTLSNCKSNDPYREQKLQTLAAYKALPLRSDAKHKMLAEWKKDKTCSWINTFDEKKSYAETEHQSGCNGWVSRSVSLWCQIIAMVVELYWYHGVSIYVLIITINTHILLRFDIASELKMDVNDPTFKKILQALPAKEWDDKDKSTYGIAMRKINEQMYHLSKDDLTKWDSAETFSQQLQSKTQLNNKKDSLTSASSSSVVVVNQDLVDLTNGLKVLVAADGKLSTAVKELKVLKQKTIALKKTDSAMLTVSLNLVAQKPTTIKTPTPTP